MSGQVIGYYIAEATAVPQTPTIKESNKNFVRIETILQDGDVPNNNARIYPSEVIQEASQGRYVQERLKTKSWFGEANHPFSEEVFRLQNVDMARASHIITSFNRESENIFSGEVETLSRSSLGETMRGAIEQGSKVGFSMRGFAKIREDTKSKPVKIIEGPMFIVTYDWVMNPSHAIATMRSIKEEEQIALEAKNITNEATCSGITDSELTSFLMENSGRFNEFQGLLQGTDIRLSSDLRTVFFEGETKAAMKLEDYVVDLYRDMI